MTPSDSTFEERIDFLASLNPVEAKENRISKQVFFLGNCGTGKTYATKLFLEKLLDNLGRSYDAERKLLTSWDVALLDLNGEYETIGDFPIVDGRKNPLWPYRSYTDPWVLLEHLKPQAVMVIEEALSVDVDDKKLMKALRELCTRRRHKKIIPITTSQRARNIPKPLLSTANYLALFSTPVVEDLRFLQGFANFDPEEVKDRKQGEFSIHKIT